MIVPQEQNKNSFHESFRWVLVFGQMCGLIPVQGIYGSNHRQLRFTWRNPILFYTLFLLGMGLVFDYAWTKEALQHHEINLDWFAPSMFYTTSLLALLLFLNLARKFPKIATYFYEIERNMEHYGYPKHLGLKTKIFIVSFASIAIAEHGTSIALNVKYAKSFSQQNNVNFGYALFLSMHRTVGEIIPYSPIVFAMLFWTNVTCTLIWNYLDFFLIAISMQISSRLRLINERVSKVDMKKENRFLWLKILQNYNQISILVKKLDKLLSKIILITLISDTYHLSLNLLRALRIQGDVIRNLYFYFSMFYLITRLVTLLFCISQIESESKKPLDYLYCIKKPTVESDRFLEQVATDDVYFTGDQFFVINRKFMTTAIGTLITYQVFLLQFESLSFFKN